jgi:hypothetical protein
MSPGAGWTNLIYLRFTIHHLPISGWLERQGDAVNSGTVNFDVFADRIAAAWFGRNAIPGGIWCETKHEGTNFVGDPAIDLSRSAVTLDLQELDAHVWDATVVLVENAAAYESDRTLVN